jgi:four helix bundle protein
MTFKDLIVWQKSIELAKAIYKITGQFPKSETYGLASQMQRCSIGIASDIAEGYGRNHRPEFVQFLGIAYGSCLELETQIIIAKSIYPQINYSQAESLLLEVQKMIIKMIQSLRNKR